MAESNSNPYFDTGFDAYSANHKWQSENTFNNQMAWDARLYGTWEREQVQEYDLNMWNLNNEYNSIGSQIERARSAGVNPAAIVGGQYKSSTSNPVTSTPQGPVLAHAGTGDAERMNAITGGVQTLANNVENFTTLYQQKRQVDSNIKLNEGTLLKLAEEAGYHGANASYLRKQAAWVDRLSAGQAMKVVQECTNLYNENYEMFARIREIEQGIKESEQRIKESEQGIKESEQRIKESEQGIKTSSALEKLYGTQEEGLSIENEKKTEILQGQIDEQTLRNWELGFRKQFAIKLNVPLGTTIEEFNYGMLKNGTFGEFYNGVLIPRERVSWKPRDFTIQDYFAGQPQLKFVQDFDPLTGVLNPTLNPRSTGMYSEEYYATRAKINEIRKKYGKKYGDFKFPYY
mgnify:CR=1 FL=1